MRPKKGISTERQGDERASKLQSGPAAQGLGSDDYITV